MELEPIFCAEQVCSHGMPHDYAAAHGSAPRMSARGRMRADRRTCGPARCTKGVHKGSHPQAAPKPAGVQRPVSEQAGCCLGQTAGVRVLRWGHRTGHGTVEPEY